MIKCRKSPASIVPVIATVSATFSFFAACGEPAEATLIISETHALEACDDAAGCETSNPADDAPADDGWMDRCTSDEECAIGQCVCGVCTESCNGEADACSGVPEGAQCFGGRTLPRAALCHASTVPGICLLPCSSDDECGDGLVCALGACLPAPSDATAP